jgi:AraC family transcriptional regulator, arabinose operon regulatory protein
MLNCAFAYTHENGITIDRPTGAGFYVFVLHKSKAELLADNSMQTVDKNTFILYEPLTKEYYHELEKPFINDWIHFDGDDAREFFAGIGLPLNRPVRIPNAHLVSQCILGLQTIKSQNAVFCENILDLDLKSMFYKICGAQDSSENSSRYLQQFSELRSELYGSPKAHFSVEELAARVHLSKSYFQHLYKELFGCSVIDDIIRGRLEYAEYLLANSAFSVSQISDLCGYRNDVHFMRQFKENAGITPSQYRGRMKYC